MAGRQMQAVISLAGKVDKSLSAAIKQAEAQTKGLAKSIGSGLASAGKTAGKAAGAATAAVGAALGTAAVAVGKAAFDNYAQYEQLIGGVETLFGDSANVVATNAASAYKSAGVSANTYMQQATSFSASLIQSLGGDTQAAAQYADTAIKDMSDNANKMGTSIEDIQGTYQSLMRGNYAMLDNLKLGRQCHTIAEYKPRENGETLLLVA